MSRKIEYVTRISKYWMDVDHLKEGHAESEKRRIYSDRDRKNTLR